MENENISESLVVNLVNQIKDKGAADGIEITQEKMAQTIGVTTAALHSCIIGEEKDRDKQIDTIKKLVSAYNIKEISFKVTQEIKIVHRISHFDSEIEGDN